MVKIRYVELPAGLHVDARQRGGDTFVYLLPGLTTAERRVALNRVRSSGRMGYGPRLSAPSMAFAVGADRIRTTASNGAAAVRVHPILWLPSVLFMSATFFALVSLVAPTVHLPAASPAASTELPDSANQSTMGSGSHSTSTGSHAGKTNQSGTAYRGRHRRQQPCVLTGLFGECGAS